MSNFIYYEKLEDYEEQVRKAKECDEKDKEIERLKQDNEYLNKVKIELSTEKNRLNNIINGLEKWLDKKEKLTFNSWNKGIHEVQRKLQELKGSAVN